VTGPLRISLAEHPNLWVAGCLVVTVVLVWLLYQRLARSVSKRWVFTLTALRMLAVLVLVLWVFKPVLSFERRWIEGGPVLLLVDDSRSMSIPDSLGGETRLNVAKDLVWGAGGLFDELAAVSDLELAAFDTTIRPLDAAAGDGTLKAAGAATAIGSALESAAGAASPIPSAVVLISDGATNSGTEPAAIVSDLGLPVYTVGLGSTADARRKMKDLGIVKVPHNQEVIVNNTVNIRVTVSCTGLDASAADVFTVVMEHDDDVVATTSFSPGSSGTQEVKLSFVPGEVGLKQYRLSIPVLPDELITTNNEKSLIINVTNPDIRILYVEGAVRPEFKFLRKTLASDPNVTLTSALLTTAQRFYVQGAAGSVDLTQGLPNRPADWKAFDVIILGDIPASQFDESQLAGLADFVSAGGGLLALGGPHAFGAGGYNDTLVEAAMPLVMGAASGYSAVSFRMALAETGKRHPIFEGCDEIISRGGRVGTLSGANTFLRAKPGAEVLATNPLVSQQDGPAAVVAVQNYGKGRSMIFGADSSWKWLLGSTSTRTETTYCKFWGQALRWLAARQFEPTDSSGPALWTDRMEYVAGDEVLIEARVVAPTGGKVRTTRAVAQVTAPSGAREEYALAPLAMSETRFKGTFEPAEAGVYKAVLRADTDDGMIQSEPVSFAVEPTAGEMEDFDLDEGLLKAVAAATGWTYHTALDAKDIPDEIVRRQAEQTSTLQLDPWEKPSVYVLFLLFVTFASAEWFLRKRKLLS